MLKTIKKFMLVAMAVVMASAVPLVYANTNAHAGADFKNRCGKSYRLLDSIDVVDEKGKKGGEMEVYWSESLGKKCVVTQSTGKIRGVEKYMAAVICLKRCNGENPTVVDYQLYSFYAGPVSLPARGQCIEANAKIHKPNKPPTEYYFAEKRGWCDL
jgi:hypothetical protein